MPPDQLSERSLARANVGGLRYDRRRVRAGVVHLGLGAFARAHVCAYLDDLIAGGRTDLGVYGVSLRHDDVRRALGPQDGLYTLGIIDGDVTEHRLIGAVRKVVHAPSDRAGVRAAMASPNTGIVTVTVTEKGYCWDAGARALDHDHPDLRHDVAAPEAPRSLAGHLLLAAADRRAQGSGGLTVLSLDNLASNGRTLRAVTLDLAAVVDPSLVSWIEDNVRFPCSVVDRIVPATDDVFRRQVAAAIGVEDAWPVRAERYVQWVVEGAWATSMPPLADVGVIAVDDVAPWEALKLRVLNALHTSAALLGLFTGRGTVDGVVADPGGPAFLHRVAGEITEVLTAPPGVDVDAYVETTLARFANSGLHHRCAQIAIDSSQKLPQRLLGTVRDRMARGLTIDALTDVLALWAWSTLGRDHQGLPRGVDDPLAATFATIATSHGDDARALVKALLALEPVFGDLAGSQPLEDLVSDRVAVLLGGRRLP